MLARKYIFLGFIHSVIVHLFMPCLLNLLILARWRFYRYFMVLTDMIHFGILGFEVFGSKIPILRVLDCHNSPRRVTTRHNELDLQNRGFTCPQLATASNCLPPQQFTRHGDSRGGFLRCVFLQKWTPQSKVPLNIFWKDFLECETSI
jgi:hypothetical protein